MTRGKRKEYLEKARILKTLERVTRKNLMINVLQGTGKRQLASWKILKRRGFKHKEDLKVLIRNRKCLPAFVLRDSLFILLKSYCFPSKTV